MFREITYLSMENVRFFLIALFLLFSSLVSKKATICLRNYTLFLTLLASTYNSLDSWKNNVFSSIQSVQQFIHKMCCSKFIQVRSWRKKTKLVWLRKMFAFVRYRDYLFVRSLIFTIGGVFQLVFLRF